MANPLEIFRRPALRGMSRNVAAAATGVDLARKAGSFLAGLTGLPEGGGVAGPLYDYLRKKERELEEAAGPVPEGQSLPEQIVEGVVQGAVELPRYLSLARSLGPVAGVATAAAAPVVHKDKKEAAKEAALAAAGTKIVQTFAKMPAVIRGVAEGAVDATQAAVSGGSPQDITAAVLTGRVLSGAGERGPSVVRPPSKRFGEAGATAGRATRELALDVSGGLGPQKRPREPEPISATKPLEQRRSFEPKDVHDLTQELQAGDYVMLTGTQEAIGPWDHPANLGANEQLALELRELGFNPVEIPDSFSEGIRQGRSFHVPDMTVQEGIRLAKKYGQQSILVGRGGVAGLLNVENMNWTPIDVSQTTIGPAAAQEPFFSTVKIGDELIPFSMKADFGATRLFNAAELGGVQKETAATKAPQRNPDIESAAKQYVQEQGLPEIKFPAGYHKQPEKVLADIADSYEAAVHDPEDPAIVKSYQDFAAENLSQWKFAQEKMGIRFEPWTQEGQPYNNSAEMIQDVTKNKHLYFFSGGDLPADHPMAQPSGVPDPSNPMRELSNNEIFRAVHDLFGHAKGGFQFGPRGEYNAFLSHYQMYGPVARSIALVNETLAQNAWVNYGRHIREAGKGITLTHFSGQEGLATLDPKFHGTGAPDAALRRGGRVPRTYYYGPGARVESFFGPRSSRPHRYQAEIPEAEVYDLRDDRLGLIPKSGSDPGKLEQLIIDSGYSGYLANVGLGPTYAIFKPLEATQVESAGIALPQRPLAPSPAERPFAEQKAVRLPVATTEPSLRPIAGSLTRPEAIAGLPRPLDPETAAYRDPELLPDAVEPTVVEVARRLEGVTKQLHGESLPKTPEGRTEALVRLMRREIPEQLAINPQAAQWYKDSIAEMMQNLQGVEPALADPVQRGLFSSILAVFSNGTKPAINLREAFDAYREYVQSGIVPSTKPDGKQWVARDAKNGIAKINRLVEKFGEAGALDFLLSKQSREKIVEHSGTKVTHTGIPDSIRKGVIFDENGEAYGAMVLGAKLGPFFLNMNGIPEVTVDRWMWRTAGRAWGDLVQLDKGGEWKLKNPQGLSSRIAFKKAVERVAKDFGISPEDVQALQWYAEKGLYEKHGAAEEAQSFGEESRKLVTKIKRN